MCIDMRMHMCVGMSVDMWVVHLYRFLYRINRAEVWRHFAKWDPVKQVYIVMAYIVMVRVVMAYIVMA